MEKYNYYENVLENVRNYYEENREQYTGMDRDELSEQLNEDCWVADCVTGNASGSYTFSAWQAEDNLCHNIELLREACEEFGSDCKILDSPEGCDVTIRCYLLPQAISELCDELEEQGVFDEEDEEDEEEEED